MYKKELFEDITIDGYTKVYGTCKTADNTNPPYRDY